MLWLTSFSVLPNSYAQAFELYRMPENLVAQLQLETQQQRRGECEQPQLTLFSNSFYEVQNKLLIFIGLPDYFCSSNRFIPVTVDMHGKWQMGKAIDSRVYQLLQTKKAYWLISHWEIEAVAPLLHYSHEGLDWQEITLPKSDLDCCFIWLKQICVQGKKLQLQFTGLENTPVEYWQTTLNSNFATKSTWQKITVSQKLPQCETVNVTSGDWQRTIAVNGKEVLWSSAIHQITLMMPLYLLK